MSFLSLRQGFGSTVCEGADRSTSGGWTQKTTRTWAWRSPLLPKSLVSTAPSLAHCLLPPPPLLCQGSVQVQLRHNFRTNSCSPVTLVWTGEFVGVKYRSCIVLIRGSLWEDNRYWTTRDYWRHIFTHNFIFLIFIWFVLVVNEIILYTWSFVWINDVYRWHCGLCDLWPLLFFCTPPLLSILSHKDSVSPVGSGARKDLCHAWPHNAREWHQGSYDAVWLGWPRAGGHHRLGQTHPR